MNKLKKLAIVFCVFINLNGTTTPLCHATEDFHSVGSKSDASIINRKIQKKRKDEYSWRKKKLIAALFITAFSGFGLSNSETAVSLGSKVTLLSLQTLDYQIAQSIWLGTLALPMDSWLLNSRFNLENQYELFLPNNPTLTRGPGGEIQLIDSQGRTDQEMQIGDIIFAGHATIPAGGGNHYAVYLGNKTFIHADGDGNIIKDTLKDKPTPWVKNGVYRLHHKELLSPEEILDRANKSLGKHYYHPALNNCQHFATWLATGKSSSPTVEGIYLIYGAIKSISLAKKIINKRKREKILGQPLPYIIVKDQKDVPEDSPVFDLSNNKCLCENKCGVYLWEHFSLSKPRPWCHLLGPCKELASPLKDASGKEYDYCPENPMQATLKTH